MKTVTLLVVDDEPAVAEFIREVADDAGFIATAVYDSPDFDASGVTVPDLLVLDLQMPGRDGVETIRALARNRKGAAVLFASGLDARMLATAAELATAQGLRVIGVLKKPFTYATLLQVLQQARLELKALLLNGPPPSEEEEATTSPPEPDAAELRAAIENGQIEVAYQPILELHGGTVVALEALARWKHLRHGSISPAVFVPAAEKHGLGTQLNWSVLSTALRELSGSFAKPLPVSVNFSASDFANLDMPDQVAGALRDTGFAPGSLCVELTESSLIGDLPTVLDTMMRLRMKGIGLWLDDFGTGYSSMEQLQRLPLTGVKIDRSLVPAGHQSPELLQSVIEISHRLGLPALVEGIETWGQLDLVRRLGCERMQGFLAARPMPCPALVNWLAEEPAWRQMFRGQMEGAATA